MFVVNEYSFCSHDLKHSVSTDSNNTVLSLLFYEHAELYRPCRTR